MNRTPIAKLPTAFHTIVFLVLLHVMVPNALACSNDMALVCGYWMHTPKTATFQNECKMREQGAKLRHTGACADKITKQARQPEAAKANK